MYPLSLKTRHRRPIQNLMTSQEPQPRQIHVAAALAVPQPLARKKRLPSLSPLTSWKKPSRHRRHPPPVPQPCGQTRTISRCHHRICRGHCHYLLGCGVASCPRLPPADCRCATFLLSFAAVVVAARSAGTAVC